MSLFFLFFLKSSNPAYAMKHSGGGEGGEELINCFSCDYTMFISYFFFCSLLCSVSSGEYRSKAI